MLGRILVLLFFVAAAGACASGATGAGSRSSPPTEQPAPTPPRRIGVCLSLVLRAPARGAHPDHRFCVKPDTKGYDSVENLERFYAWALLHLELAYDAAEVAACGSRGCATGGRGVRLHLVSTDRLSNAWIDGTRSADGPIDIFVNTMMVQLIDGTARAFIGDAVAERIRVSSDDGYRGWLKGLFGMGGADCASRIPVPGIGVPYREASPEDTLRHGATQLVFRVVLGHELAHLTNGRRCGVSAETSNTSNEQLAVEQACDSIAISRLADPRLQQATLIAVPVMAALHHYEKWLAPVYASQVAFEEQFPARDWSYRGAFLVRNWRRACREDRSLPLCEGQDLVQAEIDEFLRRPPPAPCTPSAAGGAAGTPAALQKPRVPSRGH